MSWTLREVNNITDAEEALLACREVVGFLAYMVILWSNEDGDEELAGLGKILWSVEGTLKKIAELWDKEPVKEAQKQGGEAGGADH